MNRSLARPPKYTYKKLSPRIKKTQAPESPYKSISLADVLKETFSPIIVKDDK